MVGVLDDGDSISIRPTPSNFPVRYVDGKERAFQFQIMAKSQSGNTAYASLEEIQGYLEGLTDLMGDYEYVKCETVSTVNFVEYTEKNEMVFSALFVATLDEKED